jgi:hypothetical protein
MDGIIQKVITNRLNIIYESLENQPDRIRNKFIYNDRKTLLEELQQELIEEIKKEFPITSPFGHVINYKNLQKNLIGDNE